jgi:hypothetical protein
VFLSTYLRPFVVAILPALETEREVPRQTSYPFLANFEAFQVKVTPETLDLILGTGVLKLRKPFCFAAAAVPDGGVTT